MRILLTGSTGFVGRHLLVRLQRDGHDIFRYRRDDVFLPGVNTHIDAIIHCAGEITDQSLMFESNVVLTQRLLTFARDRKISKFIQIGSSSEYGNMDAPRREDALCTPTDVYSATKLAATNLCLGFAGQDFAGQGLDVCVARPFSLYGPGDTPRKLIPRLVRSTKGGEPMMITRQGSHDYLWIDDFVEGVLVLLSASRYRTRGEIFNFGTGISTSNMEVMTLIADHHSLPAHQFISGGRSYNWVADITKARALGWAPKWDLRAGLSELIRREHETG